MDSKNLPIHYKQKKGYPKNWLPNFLLTFFIFNKFVS